MHLHLPTNRHDLGQVDDYPLHPHKGDNYYHGGHHYDGSYGSRANSHSWEGRSHYLSGL